MDYLYCKRKGCFATFSYVHLLRQVLQLSEISLISSAPEGGHMHVDVRAGKAYVHVSPPAVKTLTACLMSLSPVKVCIMA